MNYAPSYVMQLEERLNKVSADWRSLETEVQKLRSQVQALKQRNNVLEERGRELERRLEDVIDLDELFDRDVDPDELIEQRKVTPEPSAGERPRRHHFAR